MNHALCNKFLDNLRGRLRVFWCSGRGDNGTRGVSVHVVNHNYERGVMRMVEGVEVEVSEEMVGGCPRKVEVLLPDYEPGEKWAGNFRCVVGKVTILVGNVMYSSVLVGFG